MKDFFWSRTVPVVVAVVAVALSIQIWNSFQNARASESWPTVEGLVKDSRVEHEFHRGKHRYSVLVRYEFEVDGETYRSERVAFGAELTASHATSSMKDTVAEYPRGKAVSVYYQPENPKVCVLEPGVTWRAWGSLAVAAGGIVVAILVAIVLPRHVRKRREVASETADPDFVPDDEGSGRGKTRLRFGFGTLTTKVKKRLDL